MLWLSKAKFLKFGVILLKGESYSDHTNDLMVLLLLLGYAIHVHVSSESQQIINHMYQNINVL